MKTAQQLHIYLEPERLEVVDEWRWQQRLPSRLEALRQLLDAGMIAKGLLPQDDRELSPTG